VLLCLGLRQGFGPLQESSDPWFFFIRDLLIAAVFIAAVGTLHRLGRQRRQFFDVARRQRDELAREIEMAADLQRRLLTLNQPHIETLDVIAHVEPLKGVGGDYYDFIAMPDGRVCIVVADVAGKGLKAALLMPALRIALRSIVSRVGQPAGIVRELNDVLCETTEPSSYATLFLACLEPATGALTCVNAGHLPGLLRDREGGIRRLSAGGPPVGLLADAAYESETALLDLGEALVLFTDGVTDAFRGSDEEFGLDRLVAGVEAGRARSAAGLVSSIRRALDAFLDGRELTDDLTLIAVRRA
jgi:sigma-B regulation protein RsbU (phosphoserine phosphatase)